jgi:hypothetical protein
VGSIAYIAPSPLIVSPGGGPVEAAIADLLYVRREDHRIEIIMPVLFPTGSMVSVVVMPGKGGRHIVTDDGAAAHEAEMAGISQSAFSRVANAAAKRAGASFDQHALLYLDVPSDRLPGAIMVMADLAREVVAAALEGAVQSAAEIMRDAMLERLDRLFTPSRVTRKAEVRGSSLCTYQVDALVGIEGRRIVFDTFSSAPTSTSAVVSKMLDISQADDAPARVAVTTDRGLLGHKLQLVSSVCRVIESGAGDPTYQRAVKTA